MINCKNMSVNKVILIGNVGRDPEVRHLDTGVAVATFPLATTERGYTLQNGTQVPTGPIGIILYYGAAWLILLINMFIKETGCILKVN